MPHQQLNFFVVTASAYMATPFVGLAIVVGQELCFRPGGKG
jgi:hypothetical protein